MPDTQNHPSDLDLVKARLMVAADIDLSHVVRDHPLTSALIALEMGLLVGGSPDVTRTLLDLALAIVAPTARGEHK